MIMREMKTGPDSHESGPVFTITITYYGCGATGGFGCA
jgi:hypothetical protein